MVKSVQGFLAVVSVVFVQLLLDERLQAVRVRPLFALVQVAVRAEEQRAVVVVLARLMREQLLVRALGTSLVFPTPEGKPWTANRFRDRVWLQAVNAAAKNDPGRRDGRPSSFEGFTFHMLRHTAASLMALAGFDLPAAAERLAPPEVVMFAETLRRSSVDRANA